MDKQSLHQLSRLTADFIKTKTGKGPKDIKAHIVENIILIEMHDFLTPIELEIAAVPEGAYSVKIARERFSEKLEYEYYAIIKEKIGVDISHGSIVWGIKNNEAFIVLTSKSI